MDGLWFTRLNSPVGYSEAVFNWVNLLACVHLNPIRAGIVKRPEDYRWCSLGYHIQTGNKGGLLNLDFGMKEWNEHKPKEIVRNYLYFMYKTGATDRDQMSALPPANLTYFWAKAPKKNVLPD